MIDIYVGAVVFRLCSHGAFVRCNAPRPSSDMINANQFGCDACHAVVTYNCLSAIEHRWWFLCHKRSDRMWFIDIRYIETHWHPLWIDDDQEVIGSTHRHTLTRAPARSHAHTLTSALDENPISCLVHIYLCAINRLRLCMFLIESNGSSPIWLPDISKNLNDCVIELKLYKMGENDQKLVPFRDWKCVFGGCCDVACMRKMSTCHKRCFKRDASIR